MSTLDIRLVDGKDPVADTMADYVPFGVRVLKLQIHKKSGRGEKIWIRTRCFKANQDSHAIYGCADDGDDLIAVWGAGDEKGFCPKYTECCGKRRPAPLDDKEHTVYLHLIHRPPDPRTHQPRERRLTVVAVTENGTVRGEKTFELTLPTGATNPIHPVWTPTDSGSEITFAGCSTPRYVSRWWPSLRVDYEQNDSPPGITLEYNRADSNREGAIYAYLGEDKTLLASITGHLTLPLHDLRWVTPELHRFYDDKYVLRLWFYWIDKEISADDLLTFIPDPTSAQRENAEKEAARLMKTCKWAKRYEIPDLERFDIVFDPQDPRIKYGCTDRHWVEDWARVDGLFGGRIAGSRITDLVAIGKEYAEAFFHDLIPKPISNPLEDGGVVARITGGRYHYCQPYKQIVRTDPQKRAERADQNWIVCSDCNAFLSEKAVAEGEGAEMKVCAAGNLTGKNPPRLEGGERLPGGVSSNVLEG